jgi:hypothetical protein
VTLWIHPRSSAARVLALVLLVAGWGIPLAFPHLADDDLLCAAETQGPEGASSIQSTTTPTADHCAVCHLQRTFRSGDIAGDPHAVVLASAPLLLATPQQHPFQPARHGLPVRAPPA